MKPLDPRLLRHASAVRGHLMLAAFIGLCDGALLMTQAFAITSLVMRALHKADATELSAPGLTLALVVLGRALLAWAGQVAAHGSAARVKSQLRRALLTHVVRLGPSWLATQTAGDVATLAVRGTDALDDYFARYLPALITALLVPISVTIVVLARDPLSGVLVLATLPLVPLFAALVGMTSQRRARAQWRALTQLGGHFLDVVQGLPTLVVFRRAQAQAATIRRVAEGNRRATMGTLRLAFLSSAILEFLAAISVALVAVTIGLRLLAGRMDLSTGLLVLLLAPDAYWPLRQLGAQFHASGEGLAAAEQLFAVLETDPPGGVRAPAACVAAPDFAAAELRLEGVAVSYDRANAALPPLDLTVRPGEYVGVVGPSGCGKSTLLAVLLGFVAPSAGHVRIAGRDGVVDLADLDLDDWRAQIAWVPQNPWFAARSVAENVRLARPEADDAQVAEALRLANAEEFIRALPHGADTVLGAGGAPLSAGQRQRVAIARAFLRDAPLVLLDEATAHLDPDSERAIADSVRRLARGRTVIAVAHRPALLEHAGRIVELVPAPVVMAMAQ
ncbi:thiol reductant ABC exporter subunit CydD [Actinospica robiniae]|uniref:thiol reductant ABC exporter subunit CydD n=1 Tax=Actinospica robiniae TaxID=304901 RepID=UPI0004167ACD|nr:thiol reductant ABC exporter subunit CydD [Actinospica robiniae]